MPEISSEVDRAHACRQSRIADHQSLYCLSFALWKRNNPAGADGSHFDGRTAIAIITPVAHVTLQPFSQPALIANEDFFKLAFKRWSEHRINCLGLSVISFVGQASFGCPATRYFLKRNSSKIQAR